MTNAKQKKLKKPPSDGMISGSFQDGTAFVARDSQEGRALIYSERRNHGVPFPSMPPYPETSAEEDALLKYFGVVVADPTKANASAGKKKAASKQK